MSAPFEPLRGTVPRNTSSLALAALDPGSTMPQVEQWALRLRTAYADLVIDGGRLLGRPRSAVGYVHEVSAASLAAWASAEVPQWQHRGMTADDWSATVKILTEWVQRRDAAAAAAVPADARRAAELSAERAHAARRGELERQAAEAQAELAAYADAPEPPEVGPARRGGWMRRAPMPP